MCAAKRAVSIHSSHDVLHVFHGIERARVEIGIGIVGFEEPLTTWEQWLRRKAGRRAYTDGFVAHYLTGRVYPHGYELAVQARFAACVIAAYAVIIARRLRPHLG
jgi:hypothetical protein